MKPAYSAFIFLIVIVLFGSLVISDTLVFDIAPNDSELIRYYGFFTNQVSVDSIKIHLKPIILLLCIGLIGLVVFDRQRTRGKKNDKNIPS
jgi:hypothetical protein